MTVKEPLGESDGTPQKNLLNLTLNFINNNIYYMFTWILNQERNLHRRFRDRNDLLEIAW